MKKTKKSISMIEFKIKKTHNTAVIDILKKYQKNLGPKYDAVKMVREIR